jgi:tRNA (cmo5U34)-methyltransferase
MLKMQTTEGTPFDVKQMFGGERAPDYDDGIRKRIPGYDVLHATSRAVLESCLPARARLLVVGAGTGQELVGCARAQPSWTFVGVDPSTDMLDIAKRRILAADVADRVSLHVGTTSDLPPEPRFDAATALLVMHFLPRDEEKQAFLEAVACRLDPGGVLVLADMTGQPGTPAFERLFAAWQRHWCQAHGLAPTDAGVEEHFAERRRRPGWLDEQGHLALFARTGFVEPAHFWTGLLFNAWVMRRG